MNMELGKEQQRALHRALLQAINKLGFPTSEAHEVLGRFCRMHCPTCIANRAYQKQRTAMRQEAGLCVACGKRKAMKGKRRCAKCKALHAKRALRHLRQQRGKEAVK